MMISRPMAPSRAKVSGEAAVAAAVVAGEEEAAAAEAASLGCNAFKFENMFQPFTLQTLTLLRYLF
jgi:hypothetical protein